VLKGKIIRQLVLGDLEVTILSNKRLRSRSQRRILNWLLDYSGSLTDISNALNIRTPHTSLALSELRKNNYVHRDDSHGIRGAIHSITAYGRERLEQDRLSLYKKYSANLDLEYDGIVLESKDTELLLCYHKNTPISLLSLPSDPFIDDYDTSENSSGTKGVIWASVIPNSLKWYSAKEMRQITPPNELARGTLDAWLQKRESFALLRAKLFKPTNQWNVPPGTKFRTPRKMDDMQLPYELCQGSHIIGKIIGTDDVVSWGSRLHAHLTSDIDINLLINSFSDNAYVLRKNVIKPDVSTMPIDSLYDWLKLRHKRLSNEKLLGKFEEMKTVIETQSINGLSVAMQKEISKDFGYCDWINEIPQNLEISNLSIDGLKSIILHLRKNSQYPYVIEWDFDTETNLEFLNYLTRDDNCRLLVTRMGEAVQIDSSLGRLISLPKLAMARLILANQHSLDIELSHKSKNTIEVAHSVYPSDAKELLQSYQNEVWDLTVMSGKSEDFQFRDQLWQALHKYPSGNEEWANEIETSNPLAAWIATPPMHRPSRWVRISQKLDGHWSDLMEVDKISLNLLVSSINFASDEWRLKAIREISHHFLSDNQMIVETIKSENHSTNSIAIATAILLICDKLPIEFSEIIADAIDEWLDSPLFAAEVLEALFRGDGDGNFDRFNAHSRVILASKIHPNNSILYNWGKYVSVLQNPEPISNELMRNFMSLLPYQWWSGNSANWLISQLSSSSGRRWISNQSIPWPALIFRLDGELWGPPSLRQRFVRKIPDSSDLLYIPIMQDSLAKNSLMDVFELVSKSEDSNYRVTARTHPKLVYLLLDIKNWPNFSIDVIKEGDPTIGALIYGISYHKNTI
jgi:DNA-binding MarR family transcriptional regulator